MRDISQRNDKLLQLTLQMIERDKDVISCLDVPASEEEVARRAAENAAAAERLEVAIKDGRVVGKIVDSDLMDAKIRAIGLQAARHRYRL